MFGAERRLREIFDWSLVRTHTQSRAELESPRARVPCTAGYEFSTSTMMRAPTFQSNRTRSLTAYGEPWKTYASNAPNDEHKLMSVREVFQC